MIDFIRRFGRERGVTILFSAHELNQLLGVLDRVLYLGKGWRNGLAVASVIWWHDRPLWAFPRMRSDARGYPWWPGTQTFRSRAGYRSARPITSKSSLSACNARPVHTVVPHERL